jgi:hypothetical protein
VEPPAYTEARVEAADLTDLEPAERHADLVVLLVDGKPVLRIVIEVQLSRDPDKRRPWPAYRLRPRISRSEGTIRRRRMACFRCWPVRATNSSRMRRFSSIDPFWYL